MALVICSIFGHAAIFRPRWPIAKGV